MSGKQIIDNNYPKYQVSKDGAVGYNFNWWKKIIQAEIPARYIVIRHKQLAF